MGFIPISTDFIDFIDHHYDASGFFASFSGKGKNSIQTLFGLSVPLGHDFSHRHVYEGESEMQADDFRTSSLSRSWRAFE